MPEPSNNQPTPTPTPGAEGVPQFLTGPIVEQSVTIPLPREAAWALLTTPPGLRSWYTIGGGAEIELTVGGPVTLWWESESRFLGRVVTVDEPQRFDYRLAHGVNVSPRQSESTLVQFRLTDAPGDPDHSVVEVRESGFDKLSDPKEAFTASSMAWIGAFGLLQQVAKQLAAG